jgi:hypothetical protein
MQKCFVPITPQKKSALELKELSPMPKMLSHHHRTTKLEILQSPSTPHKDLFHQLLSVEQTHSPCSEEGPHNYYDLQYEIMEEEDSDEQNSKS